MSGFFKTNREIFSHPIWHNILQFRLFFLIYGNAVHSKEGFRQTETLTLKRGQWQRSYDKLIDDLKYKENNTWKKYSKTTLQRNIKVMELNGLLSTSQHELGTIFTVVNYEKYQGFQEFSKSDLEPDLEQQRNSNGTATEQQRNHNNNDNNVNNEKNEKKEDNKELTVVAKAKPKNDDKHKERDINFLIEYVRNNYNGFSDVFFEVYESYLYVRKKKKATMSINAIDYTIKQLKKKYDSIEVIISALEYCIETGYTGFFYKAENEKKQTYKNTQQRNDDLLTLELEKEMKKLNGTSIRIENT